MKQTYFIIVENVNEIFELGDYESLIEANKDVDNIEHCAHGENYVIVARSQLQVLVHRMIAAVQR